MGIPGYDDRMPEYSPAGADARANLQRTLLADLEGLAPVDDVDAVTKAAIQERHGLYLELHDAGENLRDLNVIASPAQEMRDVFDLMPDQTTGDWETIAARLSALPAAMEGYMAALREGKARGELPALRQVEAVIKQSDELADSDTSFFTSLVAGARPDDREPAGELAAALAQGGRDARQAYADLAEFLGTELAPDAPEEDGVGRERYQRFSRVFLGATVDLDETYEWGLEELARIVAEQDAVAAQLYGPGTTPEDAMARLDKDPARILHGTEELQKWMQATADEAIASLDDVHFDIPEPVEVLECCIAPTHTGGIYYTGPTADFSRPGRMWWSVPEGVTDFGTWREKTTVYHEGVPGHHLQIAQTIYRSGLLNTWRRLFSWVSDPGDPREQAAPRVPQPGAIDRLVDLEVVARDAFVVHGGLLAPGAEVGHALENGPPHAPGAREVRCGAGVVDAAGVGRGDAALQHLHRLGMSKWTSSRLAIASSAVACIHFCSSSVPWRMRAGSLSRRAIASAGVVPGPYSCAATASCSTTIRASSSSPHS